MAAAVLGVIAHLCAFTVIFPGQSLAEEEARLFPGCCHGISPDFLDAGIGVLGEPKLVVVTRRSSLKLDCLVAAEKEFGRLSFSWKLKGEPITSRSPNARVYVHRNGTLHIRKVMHRMKDGILVSDEGVYECFVTNSVGTVLAQLVKIVIASVARKFLAEPQDQTVRLGGLAYFQCYIEAVPSDLLVVWHKDRNIIRADSSLRHFVHGGTLQIRNVVPSDAGQYRCQVTNKAFFDFAADEDHEPPQWRISREGVLTVTEESTSHSPIFLAKPQNVTEVSFGQQAVLECVIGGSVPIPGVRWKRNLRSSQDFWEHIQPSSNFTILPGGSLQIHHASFADQGIYICSDNGGKISATGELRILEEPVIQEGFQSRSYPAASMIRMECAVGGQPMPTVRWLKDGADVVEKPYRVEFLDEALVIYHSNIKDSGYYQCLAENKVGWALTTARIAVRIVSDAPPAPFNVTGEAVAVTSITLRWDMENPVGEMIGFTVHQHRADGIGGEKVEFVTGNHRNITLFDLEPDTEYIIFVRAYNNYGASLNSPSVSVHTHITAHPSPVLTAVGSASISLTWSDFHGRYSKLLPIEAYRIFYGPADSEHKQQLDVRGDLDKYILKGLAENREYSIRMTAVFKGGVPGFQESNWPWQIIRTGRSSSNGIKSKGNGGSNTGAAVNPVSNAVSQNSSVPKSSNSSTSHAAFIAAPVNLYAFPLKPDAIALQWDYPTKGSSGESTLYPVTSFSIRCQAIDTALVSVCSDTSKAMLFRTSHSNTVVLEGLQPFTLYNISVSAHSGDQQGPYSRPIYVQTKEDVPSKPENLQAKIVSEGEVQLFWQPPAFPNGQIQGHYILYTNNNLDDNSSGKYHKIQYSTWTHIYQQGNNTWAHVSNLTHRIYFFQVKACTAAGTGAPSTLLMVNMAESLSQGWLSDQHLGILGGSAIGLSSILITIIVIVCRQRQLRNQLERQAALAQGQPAEHNTRPLVFLGFHQNPGVTRREELENLLPSAVTTQLTNACPPTKLASSCNCNSGNSDCSLDHPQTDSDVEADRTSLHHRPPDQEGAGNIALAIQYVEDGVTLVSPSAALVDRATTTTTDCMHQGAVEGQETLC